MRAFLMVALVGMTAAMGMGGQPAWAEEPAAPSSASPPAPGNPRPMVTTADELAPSTAAPQEAATSGASPGSTAPAAPPAPPLVIPPSLLIKRPGSAKAPYGKGPSATPPIGSVAARKASELAGYGDANATSNFFAPTAIMPPAGSVAFHSYQLLVLGMSYSPSSTFSMSAQTLVPLGAGADFIGLFSAKLQLFRSDAVRLALHGTALYFEEDDDALFGVVGGAVTFCFEPACGSHFSGYTGFGISAEDDVGVPVIFSAGLVTAIGKSVKFLLEADTGSVLGSNDFDSALLAIYGLRLGGQTFALDAGFAKPLGIDDGDLLPLGFPVVNFSFRP